VVKLPKACRRRKQMENIHVLSVEDNESMRNCFAGCSSIRMKTRFEVRSFLPPCGMRSMA